MNWREFISSLVGALAWPVALVILALVFRNRINEILSGPVQRLKVGPLEAIWDRAARKTRETEAETELVELEEAISGSPPLPTVIKTTSLREEFDALAEDHPREAVLRAYERVERELAKILESRLQSKDPPVPSGTALLGLAAHYGVLDDKNLLSLEGLLTLRNLAVHGRQNELGPGRAKEFLDLADGALFAVRFQTMRK